MHFPKWLCRLYISPNDIKKKEQPLERLTTVRHMIYFLWKNMYLWQTKALTENITGRNENQTKWLMCIQKTSCCLSVSKALVFTNTVKPR